VNLLTGFGSHFPESAAQLHRELLKRLRNSIAQGTRPDARLEGLA
jgi:hypothetical protein